MADERYKKLNEFASNDDEELFAKHADLLKSGVLNTRSRGATYTGLSMFNDDLSSLLQLPRPQAPPSSQTLPGDVCLFSKQSAGG
jgi:hypothetical protein